MKQETAAARYGKNPATIKDVADTLRKADFYKDFVPTFTRKDATNSQKM